MRLKLSLLFVFIITYCWSQSGSTITFNSNGTFVVPAGVTSIQVQAWGGGGSGGGASSAPILLGRGAAGGGGGAYASNTLLVTPGTTLNVVVAGQTPGTTGAGTAGGNSTIVGFESSILAAGGSGGAANNAGGSPLGGTGGTIAASAGSTRLAGANGGNGNSSLISLLLLSGAGGAGAGSGGAGGASISSLLLTNAPGNPGTPPGGGGSGAMNSGLGPAQTGGAGGAGRVVISYSCPNYSLTSTAATNVCASASSTSTVTLNGTASSLPVGNYVVTYNKSNPSVTGLMSNLIVTTAGTGSFTTFVGLTSPGSSTITITKITSASCSTNISSNNTATITASPVTVGGTVSGGTTIGTGSTSGLLTLSGHTGTVVKWQSSVSPFTTWTDIANTAVTYTSGPLTATTQFRAVVQSGDCGPANSAPTTVTVEELPTAIIGFVTNSCSDGVNDKETTLPLFGVTGDPQSYSIVWNPSPANNLPPVVDGPLPLSTFIIDVPADTAPGTYTGILTVKKANGITSLGYPISLTVVAFPSVTTSGIIDSVCSSTELQYASLSYTNPKGNPTSYSIDWDDVSGSLLVFQGSTAVTFGTGPGVINTIEIPANTAPGTYTGTLRFTDGECPSFQQVSITIVPESVGGTVTGGTTITSGSTSGLLTLSGHTGSVLVWQSSVSPFTNWTDIANTTTTYTSGPLTQTTQFRAVVQSGSCSKVNSEPTTVTVADPPTITLSSAATSICRDFAATTTTLSYSAVTGTPTTYSIVWDPSPANSFAAVTDAALPASPITIAVPAAAAVGTYTGTLTVKNANGDVSAGSSFTLTINQIPSITTQFVITAAPVASSTNSQNTSFTYLASSGNPTSYSINWDNTANNASLADQPSTPFSFAPSGGTVNNVVVSANAQPGTYSGILTIANEFCTFSINVSLKINAKPAIQLSNNAIKYCMDNYPYDHFVSLPYTATTGSPVTYSIVWDSSPSNTFTAITNAALPSSPIQILIPLGTPSEIYTGTLTVKNSNGDISDPLTFTLKVGRGFNLTGSSDVAPVPASTSAQTSSLTYTAITGNVTSYSINWNDTANSASLQDQPETLYTFFSGGGTVNNIAISANVLAGYYTGIITYIDGNCSQEKPIALLITEPETVAIFDSNTARGTSAAANSVSISSLNQVITVDTNQLINTVSVFDVSGALLYNKEKVSDSKLTIDNLRSANQVLIVKVQLNDNRVETKKIIF